MNPGTKKRSASTHECSGRAPKTCKASSPPSEVEVLKILLEANVRGLPQPHALEVDTRIFPDVALPASTANLMAKLQASYISNHTSKPLAPDANVGNPSLRRVKVQRQKFSDPLQVRRQRPTRVLMSYCAPLKEAMRTRGPAALMRIIRDAMIVYYEAYKLPESGFIHGGKYFMNVLCFGC
jgi:hypothetical protein